MDTPVMPSANKPQQTANTTITSPRKIRRFIDLFRTHEIGFEKQRKQAFYNLIGFTAFFIFIFTVVCCYLILQQFLRYADLPKFKPNGSC